MKFLLCTLILTFSSLSLARVNAAESVNDIQDPNSKIGLEDLSVMSNVNDLVLGLEPYLPQPETQKKGETPFRVSERAGPQKNRPSSGSGHSDTSQ